MANENKPLNEAKPNEPITAQRWNDMQLALRKEHIEHSHNGKWKDGQFAGSPLDAEGLADNAVITARIADGAVTGAKVDASSDYKVRTLAITGEKLPPSSPTLSVGGTTLVTGVLRVNPAGKDSLVAGDGFVEAGGGGNPLRLTSLWSGFPDTKPNASEISNDTNTYKALMIVGNRSAGGVRKVSMWDRVEVMGRLVVGPGQDAGLTVNGLVDASAFKTPGDVSSSTLNVTAQANLAALKVTGTTNSGPVNITGALSVSEPIVAVKGLQVGSTALQAFNRVQIQGGGLHMDGNPIYLRANLGDQYDLLRWNPNGDVVDLGGYQGVNLGFTKGAVNVVAPVLSVRDTFVEVGTNANALRFTSGWSNFPAAGTNLSEISNDIGTYKCLMVIGNRSGGGERRVGVWDTLNVNGTLNANGTLTVNQSGSWAGLRVTNHTNRGVYMNLCYEGANDTFILYHQNGQGQYMRQDGVWNRNSDRSLKHDVTAMDDALDLALRLRPVRFKWNATGTPCLGFIAQEVLPLFPEIVSETTHGEGDAARKVLGLKYDTFGVIAVAAVQQLKQQLEAKIALDAPLVEAVKEQQQQIAGLRRELAILRSRLL